MLLFFSPSQVQPLFPTTSFTPRWVPATFTPHRRTVTEAAASRKQDAFTQYSGYLFQMTASEAESLAEYDISKIRAVYLKKPFILLRRLFQITTTLGKWFALRYYDTFTERADLLFEVRAAELRKILAQLGPAYVKIAQAISSRPALRGIRDIKIALLDCIQNFFSHFTLNKICQHLVGHGMMNQDLSNPSSSL